MSSLAPIALFVYNRPQHTEQTLIALMDNRLATECTLYIFADGATENASPDQLTRIADVRTIIRARQWCGTVNLVESEQNKGLAQSIKDGVTKLVEQYGRAIVLEDDLVTSPAFLTYMNKALDYYQNHQSVFSISGYCLPPTKLSIPADYNYDVFVSLRNSSWGWATWQNRWAQVDWSVASFASLQNNPIMQAAFNRGGDDVYEMLEAQQAGTLNIWSIQFTVAHFANHAISVVPTRSYVDNIGLDGSGENCSVSTVLRNSQLNENEDPRFLDVLYQDSRIINRFYNANCRTKRPVWQKIINQLSRIVGKKPVFIVKKKIYV